MDTKGQFSVFCICIAVGFVGGLLYEAFGVIRWIFGCSRGKNKTLCIALDILFFLSFAILSVFAAYNFRFPAFRVYMWLGNAVGFLLYLKILHRIVAFFENMCYNKVIKLIKKAKNREKTLQKEVDKQI